MPDRETSTENQRDVAGLGRPEIRATANEPDELPVTELSTEQPPRGSRIPSC